MSLTVTLVAFFYSPTPFLFLLLSGDEVRRAVWFLDTRRHGLQPYGEEAQAVLEDAYLFLKWRSEFLKEGFADPRDKPPLQTAQENTCPENGSAPETTKLEQEDPITGSALLTVQVESPDGTEQQLVQFSSLTAATAIKKGLGGAISLFKRRVYRGADLSHPVVPTCAHGVTPEAVFSGDVNLKSQHQTRAPNAESHSKAVADDGEKDDDCDWTILHLSNAEKSLTVPPSQFDEIDRDPIRSGEKEDSGVDDIDHLVLIVHGIGEMLRSVDLFGLAIPNLSSIIDCCGWLRKNHAEVQSARFSQMYPTCESISTASTGRVEYLPIEWHEAFSIMSHRMSPSMQSGAEPNGRQFTGGVPSRVMMQDISLRTIPQMRTFANDTLFDVLYFMSAEHHDVIIDICTSEMNIVVQKFRVLTGFRGRVSLIGHSLGSIIAWDILAHQIPNKSMESCAKAEVPLDMGDTGQGKHLHNVADWEDISDIRPQESLSSSNGDPGECEEFGAAGPLAASSTRGVEDEKSRADRPDSLIRSPWQYPTLTFDVDNAFMLGSPIAVFLMVRNQRRPLSEEFSLPGCPRLYNIFHPYDPVAYRIEPLIDACNSDFEPRIVTHWNGGFRVQYQTKRLWRKLVQTTLQTQQSVIERFEAGIAGMGLLDSTGDVADDENQSQPSSTVNDDDRAATATHVVTGKLNQGRRIDYMLQEKEIEAANEYVAAFAAHSCYWQEKDLSLFVARQIYLSRLAHEQALHFEDLLPSDDSIVPQP
jgi:DDHD domain